MLYPEPFRPETCLLFDPVPRVVSATLGVGDGARGGSPAGATGVVGVVSPSAGVGGGEADRGGVEGSIAGQGETKGVISNMEAGTDYVMQYIPKCPINKRRPTHKVKNPTPDILKLPAIYVYSVWSWGVVAMAGCAHNAILNMHTVGPGRV